jgi:hypothetical protein
MSAAARIVTRCRKKTIPLLSEKPFTATARIVTADKLNPAILKAGRPLAAVATRKADEEVICYWLMVNRY